MMMPEERQAWIAGLNVGDAVKLTTLLGIHRGQITKKTEGKIIVKIISEDDKDIIGWEVHLNGDGTGQPSRVCNRIDPIDESESVEILEHIGEPTKDLPFGGWEAA